jgi:ornithine carbamoyltransferase
MSRSSTLRSGVARVRGLKPSLPTSPGPLKARSFISLGDFTPEAIDRCLELAVELKAARAAGRRGDYMPLATRQVALLFDKPSLRTRVTFEVAVRELGGSPILLPADVALGSREPISDVARNLERWVDVVVIRTFAQQIVEEFASAAPALRLINALTDEEHPCQALADVLTLRERFGDLAGRTIAYVGDGNNVATSLAEACVMQGMHVRIASPEGYELPQAIQQRVAARARDGATLTLLNDPVAAVRGASAVYTDVWTSMGQENETAIRKHAFEGFQVDEALMAHADADAIFMHCLPAHRGEEVSAAVMDGPSSVVFDQAENRLHAQKALLAMLFE